MSPSDAPSVEELRGFRADLEQMRTTLAAIGSRAPSVLVSGAWATLGSVIDQINREIGRLAR